MLTAFGSSSARLNLIEGWAIPPVVGAAMVAQLALAGERISHVSSFGRVSCRKSDPGVPAVTKRVVAGSKAVPSTNVRPRESDSVSGGNTMSLKVRVFTKTKFQPGSAPEPVCGRAEHASQPLVIAEEEELVLDDRAADGATELVLVWSSPFAIP